MGDNLNTRILIVEDNATQALPLQTLLERSGFEVHAAHTGDKALFLAAEQRMDLVVLDVMLPDRSGYDICVELRRLYHPWILPVVMLTALDRPQDKLLGFGHGADAYLTKPVPPSEILSTIQSMLIHVVG